MPALCGRRQPWSRLIVFDFLLERGLNVECKEPYFGGTALMELAGQRTTLEMGMEASTRRIRWM